MKRYQIQAVYKKRQINGSMTQEKKEPKRHQYLLVLNESSGGKGNDQS